MQTSVCSGDVVGASTKTILALLASATRRAKVLQIIIACSDTPADATAIFALRKITADGTGSAVTPQATDANDGAPSCTAKKNYTVEPTYAAGDVIDIPLNQRVTCIWNAPFAGAPNSNLSSGTDVGWGLQMISGPALNYRATFIAEE